VRRPYHLRLTIITAISIWLSNAAYVEETVHG